MDSIFDIHIYVDKRMYTFNVRQLYYGKDLVRFSLRIGRHELELQKRLSLKKNSWGILYSSFQFTREDAAYTLLRIYRLLDERLGVIKQSSDQQKRDKD